MRMGTTNVPALAAPLEGGHSRVSLQLSPPFPRAPPDGSAAEAREGASEVCAPLLQAPGEAWVEEEETALLGGEPA